MRLGMHGSLGTPFLQPSPFRSQECSLKVRTHKQAAIRHFVAQGGGGLPPLGLRNLVWLPSVIEMSELPRGPSDCQRAAVCGVGLLSPRPEIATLRVRVVTLDGNLAEPAPHFQADVYNSLE